MKRTQKEALLTKLVQGQVSEQTRRKLRETQNDVSIIGIIRHGSPGPTPDCLVTVPEGQQKRTMPRRDLEAYARRRGGIVLFIFPDNEHTTKPTSPDTTNQVLIP